MENENDIQRIEKELRERIGTRKKPKLPTGYFDAFADRVMHRIKETPSRRFILNTWLLPLTAAASFALLMIFSTQGEQAKEERATAEIQETRLAPLVDVDESEVEEILEEVNLEVAEVLPRVEAYILESELADSYQPEDQDDFDKALDEVSQEEIEDYLLTTLNYNEL